MVTDGGVQQEGARTDPERHPTEAHHSLPPITVKPQKPVHISVLLPQRHLEKGLTDVCRHSDPPAPKPKQQVHQAGDKTRSHLQAIIQ